MISLRALACFVLLGFQLGATDNDHVRRIQNRFLAPCCWQESVAVHRSEVAGEMRSEIARWVADGKSEEQIVGFYVARYGERILREPRGAKRWWLTLIPLVAIALATAGLVLFVRSHQKQKAPTADAAEFPALPDVDLD